MKTLRMCPLNFSFLRSDSPSKTMKNAFYFIENAVLILVMFLIIFFLPFRTFQIQKDK